MTKTESDHVYVLFLNDMRSAHSEDLQPVAWASVPEPLRALLDRERVEVYREETGMPATGPETEPSGFGFRCNPTSWVKHHRKGGPLEWFNPPHPGDECVRRVARRVTVDVSDDLAVLVECAS